MELDISEKTKLWHGNVIMQGFRSNPFPMALDMQDELFKEHGKLLDDLLEIPLLNKVSIQLVWIDSDLIR